MLPNPNPSGTVTSDMMALSFQESTMYAVQSIDENIRGLRKLFASFLKVNTENLNTEKINRARERSTAAEEKRESKFGTTLKSAATGVKDKAIEVGKGISLGGVLSTLIGGALLGAFLAPEKTDELLNTIKKSASNFFTSDFFKGVGNAAWEIFKENLNLPNLFVTALFGWRAGAITAAFTWLGRKVVESLGLKEQDGNGEVTLGSKIEDYLAKNLPAVFGGVGLFASLFPIPFFKGLGILTLGVGRVLSRTIRKAFGFGVGELTVEAADAAADKLIDPKDKTDLKNSANKTRGRLKTSFKNLFRTAIRGFAIAGAVYAAYEFTSFIIEKASEEMEEYKKKAAEFEAQGKTIGQAFGTPKFEKSPGTTAWGPDDENDTMDYNPSVVSTTPGKRRKDSELIKMSMGLAKNIAQDEDVGGEAAGKTQNERISKQLEGLKNLDWKEGKKFLERFATQSTSTGASLTEGDFKTIMDWIKTLANGVRPVSYYTERLKAGSFGSVKIGPNRKDARYRLEEASKESKSSTAPTPVPYNDNVMGDTLETPEGVAKYLNKDNTNKNANKELMKSRKTVGWIQQLGNWLANVPNPSNVDPTSFKTNMIDDMDDFDYKGGEPTAMMAPTYKAGSLRMSGLEAEMVSINNAMKSQAPIVIASPSSSSPTSVDQSQTIINNSNRKTTISGGLSQYTQSPTRSAASRFSVAFT